MACNGETMQPLPAGNVAGTRNTVQPDDSAPSEVHKVRARTGCSVGAHRRHDAGLGGKWRAQGRIRV